MNLPIYFDFDLLKAKRDTSKLVKVQRSVTRGGKTFMQDFWVKPGDVKKTDIVIGGQQNLIPDLSKIQAPAKGTWDKSYFDALSKQTDKSLMVNYLKDCGVTWTESTNKGINLMRALMAAKNKGLLPKKTANSSQTSTNNSSANQSVPANGTNSVPKDLSSVMTDLQALSSSKEKVQFLKKKWGIQKLLDFATNVGVTWNVNANDGINKMRMQMALKAYFDTLDWGTTGKVGAPLGNQNAKKDTVVQAPPVDPNKIVVPDNATERIKNLIELINEISDKPTLELIGKSGIVPEDDLSKSFLEQKLWKEYSQKISGSAKSRYSTSNYWIFGHGDKELVKSRVDFLSKGLKGFSKIPLRELSKKLKIFAPNSELEILYPRNTFQWNGGIWSEFFDSTREHDLLLSEFLKDLKKFSQYSDVDNPKSKSTFTDSVGNIWNMDGYYVDGTADFDMQKEGIKVLLDYISSQQPDLKDSCKKLEERYKNLMLKVDNNLKYLDFFALDNTSNGWKRLKKVRESWSNLEQGMPEFYKAWKDQGFTDEELKATMETYAKCLLSSDYPGGHSIIYNAGTKDWNNQDFGWSPDEQQKIKNLFLYTWTKQLVVFDKTGQPLRNSHGDLITFSYKFNVQNPSLISNTGMSQLTFDNLVTETQYSGGVSFNTEIISLVHMYDIDHPILKNLNLVPSENMLRLKQKIKERDFSNHIGETKYCEIADELLKLFGLKIVNKQTLVKIPSYDYVNLTYAEDYITVPDNDDIQLDATLGNLINLIKADKLAKGLLQVAKHHKDSPKNNNGSDYSQYFNYQTKSIDSAYRGSFTGTGLAVFTEGPKWYGSEPEVRFKNYDVNQLQQFKVYSPSFFKDAREYYDDNGQSNAGYYNNSPEEANKVVSLCVDRFGRLNDPSFKSPMKNVFIDTLTSLAKFCPNNYTKNQSKNQKYFDDFMSDQKFVFSSSSKSQTIMPSSNVNTELLNLRKKAFKNAKCSLSHVTGQNKTDVEHKVKLDFDRVDPTTGKRVWKGDRVYDNRTMVFHDVYEIKNSNMEDEFKKEADQLKETPVTRYHGTSYTGACGIMGVDGRFRYKHTDKLPGQKHSGTMLGQGIYTAKLVGKTLPYIGNNPYTYNHYTASDITTPNNEADGVLLVMDTLLGKYGEFSNSRDAEKNNKNEGGTYDSVAVGAGGLMPGGNTLLEYEAIVTRNSMLLPKYMVDCGGRRR